MAQKDHFLRSHLMNAKHDHHFTKTGSGQTQGKMASKLYSSSIKIFDPKRNSGPATLCTLCRAHPTPPPVKPPQPAATCDLRIVLIAHVNIGWVHRLCRLNLGSSNERIVV